MNNLNNFPRAVKNQDVSAFEAAKSGIYLIAITARCKNWLQNIGRLFNDDDLAIQIDDFLFTELSGKKYEFKSAGTWNGNKIKNAKKTVFFLLPLEAGAHEIKFWADGAPFVEEISVELQTAKKLVISPQPDNKYVDLIIKNILVDKARVKNDFGKSTSYNFENSGKTGVSSLSLDCKKLKAESVEFSLGAVKNKLGKIKLYKDLILSNEVNLRTEHNQESKIVANIPDGEEVEIITEKVLGGRVPSYTDIWHEVIWQGKRGYVLSSFVEIQGQERQTIIDLIKTKCLEYKVDSNIILAIAGQESRFKPYAASGSGPTGIFQLSGLAAKQVGVKDTFNFFENIIGGIKYYKWIEGQYSGRGKVLERRLAAWHNGPGAVSKKGPIDYNKLGKEAEKFVKNVLENIKKKDWFHLASLALAIILAMAGPTVLSIDSLNKINNNVFALVAKAAPKDDKTKFIFHDDTYDGVPTILVKSVVDNNWNATANFYYENKRGESHSEFLDGYLTNAGWVNLEYTTRIFWIERSVGHGLITSFFAFDPNEGIFKKIIFADRDGTIHDYIRAPFDILSVRGEAILRETAVNTYYFTPLEIRKYKYHWHGIFKEIL